MTDSQRWLAFAALAATGYLLYLLAPVLTPFATAALLAYIGDPLVDRLEERKLSRTWSVVLVFLLLSACGAALLVLVLPLLEQQLVSLARRLPAYIDWLQRELLPRMAALLGVQPGGSVLDGLKQAISTHWQQAGGIAMGFVSDVSKSGLAVLGWLANLVLIPVVTFYLLRDWDRLVARVRGLLPRAVEPTVSQLTREADRVLAEFFRGQILVMLALAGIYTLGLWLVGLDLALLVGLVAGLVSFVPYLGFLVGIVLAGLAAFFQFHELLPLLYVAGVFGIGQLVEGMVLTPMLVGERIGLHPVAVIFAVLAGGQLFGFMGVLLALPVAAVIVVLLRHMHRSYLGSDFYQP